MSIICTNCGATLPNDTLFCNKCGMRVISKKDTSTSKVCKTCGALLSAKAEFCGACGTAVEDVSPTVAVSSETAQTFVISRASQFFYTLSIYDVYIDGFLLGRIPSGQSVALRVFSNTVKVEIKCPLLFMKRYNLWAKLKLIHNPRLEFSLIKQGEITINVSGAEILEQGKH